MTAVGNGENMEGGGGEHCVEQPPEIKEKEIAIATDARPNTATTANDTDGGGDADGHIPIEMQLYEVEVTEQMDPLEYAFR